MTSASLDPRTSYALVAMAATSHDLSRDVIRIEGYRRHFV